MPEEMVNVNTASSKFKTLIISKAKWIGIILLLLLPIFFLLLVITNTAAQSSDVPKENVLEAKKTYEINKEYIFPLKNSEDKDVGKVKYTIENTQLVDEIIIKGQKAIAVQGKTFLIINLKLTNSLNQPIQIDTRDYIRLILDGKEQDLIAPEIHNDPVEIQPISTKFTRVGIPINENFKKLQLKVGEINGDKATLDIKL